jgi:tRNA/rRNA methyltransferase/tRNA (cytidine32/uridine32-2'-O)-methyltransferase
MRCALEGAQVPGPGASEAAGGASVERLERLFEALQQALTAVGFHDPQQPRQTMARLRSLFARAALAPSEVDLLLGICAAMVEPKRLRAGRKKG